MTISYLKPLYQEAAYIFQYLKSEIETGKIV